MFESHPISALMLEDLQTPVHQRPRELLLTFIPSCYKTLRLSVPFSPHVRLKHCTESITCGVNTEEPGLLFFKINFPRKDIMNKAVDNLRQQTKQENL